MAANSDKLCFVIMPIGKEGSVDNAHFRSIFEVLIKPAAQSAGYEVRRADDSSFTGSISKEIVESLARADLVIADLTDRNPNVYLELGIRHCLRKSGTIHLIRSDQALPFDVAGYRAIKYSTDFDKIDSIRMAIFAAIEQKASTPNVPDNPVHDNLNLPSNYAFLATSEEASAIQRLEHEVAEAHKELEALRRRYPSEKSSLADGDTLTRFTGREIAARLTAIASQVRDNSLPAQLVYRAQQLAAQGDLEGLLVVAEKLLASPFTSGSELSLVANLAGAAGLQELRLLILEHAAAKFPSDGQRRTRFAEACIHTADPETQERGRRLMEKHLGVVWKDGQAVFTKGRIAEADEAVGILLDYFHSNERVDEELALVIAATAVYGETPIILRNMGRAYEDIGDDTKAEDCYSRSVMANPTDDTSLSWLGNFHARRREWEAARSFHVRACLADSGDPSNVVKLLTVVLAESEASGFNHTETLIQVCTGLAGLAISISGGSPATRSQCAQMLSVARLRSLAASCFDPHWPALDDLPGEVTDIIGADGIIRIDQ